MQTFSYCDRWKGCHKIKKDGDFIFLCDMGHRKWPLTPKQTCSTSLKYRESTFEEYTEKHTYVKQWEPETKRTSTLCVTICWQNTPESSAMKEWRTRQRGRHTGSWIHNFIALRDQKEGCVGEWTFIFKKSFQTVYRVISASELADYSRS